jgi:nicotinate phosphoribosyltransferase
VAIEKGDQLVPKIKISENVQKITNPGYKQVYRFYNQETHKAIADVITLHDEVIDENKPYELFDPEYTWKRKTVTNFYVEKLLEPIFIKGVCVYQKPSIQEIRAYCQQKLDTLWDEVKRFEHPHKFIVDLSQPLWDLKEKMIIEHSHK